MGLPIGPVGISCRNPTFGCTRNPNINDQTFHTGIFPSVVDLGSNCSMGPKQVPTKLGTAESAKFCIANKKPCHSLPGGCGSG